MTEMFEFNVIFEPEMIVAKPVDTNWGQGQLQSITESRTTVNFEQAGKLMIDGNNVLLEPSLNRGGH